MDDYGGRTKEEKLMNADTSALAGKFRHQAPMSKSELWGGRIMSGLPALFLIVDGIMKLIKPPSVVQATIELGYSESVIASLGIILLGCTVLYLIPPTSIFGAILLTGYLGGAIATQVRVGNPLFTHILFPAYLALLLWAGLLLRDERVRTLIRIRG
jgi:hypothetical protein